MGSLELAISLTALAPLSNASGSNPAEVVLGLSLRTRGGAGVSFCGGESPAGVGDGDGEGEGAEENGEKLKRRELEEFAIVGCK